MSCGDGGCVQEIKNEGNNAATRKHGYGPKYPKEEREWEVESSQSKRPEVASPIQVSCNILDTILSTLPCWNSGQEANMGIVSNRLHIAEKGNKKTQQDREVLDWR